MVGGDQSSTNISRLIVYRYGSTMKGVMYQMLYPHQPKTGHATSLKRISQYVVMLKQYPTQANPPLPPEIPSCALLPIGWPKGKYGNPPRASVDEKLFYERFVSDVPADT